MNREDAKVFKFINYNRVINSCVVDVNELNKHIDKIYDDFAKDLKEINNQISRLKKQLANNHHIECMCSFCKPMNESVNKLNCEKCRHYYTEYKFDLLFDRCKSEECNWDLKC